MLLNHKVVTTLVDRHTYKLQNLCLLSLTLKKLANFVVSQRHGTVILTRALYSPGKPHSYVPSLSWRWMSLWKGCPTVGITGTVGLMAHSSLPNLHFEESKKRLPVSPWKQGSIGQTGLRNVKPNDYRRH